MADPVVPGPVPGSFFETRLRKLTVENLLDSTAGLGEPGKARVSLELVRDLLDGNRSPAHMPDGQPIRQDLGRMTFDPALYLGVTATRPDGSTFTIGALLFDLCLMIDEIKTGLPPLPSDEPPPDEPPPEEEPPP